MTEACGYEAQTIHRMLEISGGVPDGDRKSAAGLSMFFERNEDNPLEADVIIVDEMSMVDISIMNSLLKAVSIGTKLILVGDVDPVSYTHLDVYKRQAPRRRKDELLATLSGWATARIVSMPRLRAIEQRRLLSSHIRL